MIALTAALAVALSLGAGDGRARPPASSGARAAPAALSNAARAKMGLLPRKAPRKAPRNAVQARRPGRRIITTVSHQPTLLGEPIPLAEAPPERGEVEAAVDAPLAAVAAPREVRDMQVSVSSVVTEVTMVLRYGP